MKRILVIILAALLPLAIVGCNAPPKTVAYKTEAVVIVSVDGAMKGWADWVKAGHATQTQVDAVKVAYNKYYASQQVAKACLSVWIAGGSQDAWDIASEAATRNESALLALINAFKK